MKRTKQKDYKEKNIKSETEFSRDGINRRLDIVGGKVQQI